MKKPSFLKKALTHREKTWASESAKENTRDKGERKGAKRNSAQLPTLLLVRPTYAWLLLWVKAIILPHLPIDFYMGLMNVFLAQTHILALAQKLNSVYCWHNIVPPSPLNTGPNVFLLIEIVRLKRKEGGKWLLHTGLTLATLHWKKYLLLSLAPARSLSTERERERQTWISLDRSVHYQRHVAGKIYGRASLWKHFKTCGALTNGNVWHSILAACLSPT